MERLSSPRHLLRCFKELGVMALNELVFTVNEAQDCFGPDSAEDAAVPSSIPERVRAA